MSCFHAYEHHIDDFPDFGWDKNRTLTYEVPISDTSTSYSLTISFRHIYGFTFESVPIKITVSGQEGTIYEAVETLLIFDNNNKMLSDCAGDYCDIDQTLQRSVTFHSIGTYSVSLQHQFQSDILPYVMEVGVILNQMKE